MSFERDLAEQGLNLETCPTVQAGCVQGSGPLDTALLVLVGRYDRLAALELWGYSVQAAPLLGHVGVIAVRKAFQEFSIDRTGLFFPPVALQ